MFLRVLLKNYLKRRNKILKIAKGFRGTHSKLFRMANEQVMKALRYSYVGRKRRKREFRSLWIVRINAAARANGATYSTLMSSLKNEKIAINRKMLSQIAVLDSKCFTTIFKFIVKS